MSATDLPERGWTTRHTQRDLTGKPALFLDRDGTVIENVPYLADPAEVSLILGARETIAAFRDNGYAVIIVTNQSGFARGLVSPDQYRAVESAVIEGLGSNLVDATYACPFHPNHPWRKPEPGMLLAAARDHGLILAESIMTGDTLADMIAGAEARVGALFHVRTGHGAEERAAVEAWAKGRLTVRFADALLNLFPFANPVTRDIADREHCRLKLYNPR
ncbi:D-glycero-alpha-D-manno-heptose-1,7-bisphosphate 7-phosphatase [Sphingomonas pruni]|uniref:D-glycero-alpha-D-manno-heptose-1,7-bisphosphate 7-phosphatase n=1 Tax=Sphingomonas pruni TaxID=40683 RepID=UPI00082D7E35|nr:HAD-IIIA family hydrolase [Sphingomonas pruni]